MQIIQHFQHAALQYVKAACTFDQTCVKYTFDNSEHGKDGCSVLVQIDLIDYNIVLFSESVLPLKSSSTEMGGMLGRRTRGRLAGYK